MRVEVILLFVHNLLMSIHPFCTDCKLFRPICTACLFLCLVCSICKSTLWQL